MKKILINIVISIVLGVAIFLSIIHFSSEISVKKIIGLFSKDLWIKIILIYIIIYILNAFKLFILVKSLGYRIKFLYCLENVFFGNFFSFVTPMALGGQPFQIFHLHKLGIKSTDATNVIMSRTLETMFTTLIVDIALIKIILDHIPSNTVGLGIILAGFFAGLTVAVMLLLGFIYPQVIKNIFSIISKTKFIKIKKLKDWDNKLEDWILKLKESTEDLWKNKFHIMIIDIFLWFIITLLQPLPLFLIFSNLFENFKIPFLAFYGIYVMLNTISYYIPTPGASGGVESFYHLVFSKMVGNSISIVGIMTYRFISYYMPIFIGVILIWRMKFLLNYYKEAI